MSKQKKILHTVCFCLFYATLATTLTGIFHHALKNTYLEQFSAMEKLEDGIYDWVKRALVANSKTFNFFGTTYASLSSEMQRELDQIALINIDKGAYDDTRNEAKKKYLATCLNLLKETDVEAVFIEIMFNKKSLDPDTSMLTKAIKEFEKTNKKLIFPYLLQTEKGHNINGDTVKNTVPIIYDVKHTGFAPLGSYDGSQKVRFFKTKIDTHEYAMYKLIRLLDPDFKKYPHLENIDEKRKEINYLTNIRAWEGHKTLPYAFHLSKKVYPSNTCYVDSLYHYALSKENECDNSSSVFCRKWNALKDKKVAIIGHLEHYTNRQMQFINKADTPVDSHISGTIILLNIYLNLVTNSWIKKGSLYYIFIINFFLAIVLLLFNRSKQTIIQNPIILALLKIVLSLVLFFLIATSFFYFYIKLPILLSLLLFQKDTQMLETFDHLFDRKKY